jgi:hypothetical protein
MAAWLAPRSSWPDAVARDGGQAVLFVQVVAAVGSQVTVRQPSAAVWRYAPGSST